jgi:hypothetical protein
MTASAALLCLKAASHEPATLARYVEVLLSRPCVVDSLRAGRVPTATISTGPNGSDLGTCQTVPQMSQREQLTIACLFTSSKMRGMGC